MTQPSRLPTIPTKRTGGIRLRRKPTSALALEHPGVFAGLQCRNAIV